MAEYVLIKISDSSIQKRTDSDRESVGFPPDLTAKDLKWYPVIRNAKPAFDPDTHKIAQTEGIVVNDYVHDWSIIPLTQPEIDARAVDKDIDFVLDGLLDLAEIVIIHIDAHLAKGNIAAADFNAATRQKYQDLKVRVDRLRGA